MSFETLHLWNRRWTARIPVFVLFFLATVATFLLIGGYLTLRNYWTVPPASSGDEPVYDSIGWELSQGNGYQLDFTNPEFRQPYDQADRQLTTSTRDDNVPDTVRPPLFPFVISWTNRLLGRQFWGVRLWNLLCISVSTGITAVWLNRRAGLLSILLLIPLAAVVDVRTRLYSRAILTEATSVLTVTLMTLALLRLFEHVHRGELHAIYRWAFFSGICATLSLYTRSNILLWLPVIAISIGWSSFQKTQSQRLRRAAMVVGLFVMTIAVGYAPWAIRNIRVTGAFFPLGTQGATQLSAAWGDEIWESRGIWNNLQAQGFFDKLDDEALPPMKHRVAQAQYSQSKARNWIVHHPTKSVLLIPLKIGQEFRPHHWSEAVILLLATLGLWKMKPSPARRTFLTLILAAAFGVGLTWSVEGRFLVPLLFVWHSLAVSGLVSCLGLNSGEELSSVTVN
ncbi:MAG: glycosyltransferase family 39 protein [Planctomycetaceae bacterium]|nr:glycosyltransferase family 39 protein [Planctomycetaceae bacterium]